MAGFAVQVRAALLYQAETAPEFALDGAMCFIAAACAFAGIKPVALDEPSTI
jgi:hypothetical protein